MFLGRRSFQTATAGECNPGMLGRVRVCLHGGKGGWGLSGGSLRHPLRESWPGPRQMQATSGSLLLCDLGRKERREGEGEEKMEKEERGEGRGERLGRREERQT